MRGPTAKEDFLTLESRQLLIEPAVEYGGAGRGQGNRPDAAPTLVYLADTLSDGKADVPYVVVAALDPAAPPPLGPFLPKGVSALKDDEIVLAEWPESPITTKPGDTITLSYYPPEQHGEFRPGHAQFKLAGTIPMAGPAADPGLTPELPGVTDKTKHPRLEARPFPSTTAASSPATASASGTNTGRRRGPTSTSRPDRNSGAAASASSPPSASLRRIMRT